MSLAGGRPSLTPRRSSPTSTSVSAAARRSARCRTASSTRSTPPAAYQENLTASESRITDVDMAPEMVNFTKNQILVQAGTAMLSQANQAPQAVLSLLH